MWSWNSNQSFHVSSNEKEGKMTRRSLGTLTAILVCAVFLIILIPNPTEAADRKTFTLRVTAGHPYAAGTFWIRSLEDFFCREVEKRVAERTQKYRLKCKSFYGGSLAKLGEVFETVERGLADIGLVVTVFEMSKIELFNFTYWIPFTTDNMALMLKATIKTIDQFPHFDQNLAKYNQRRVGSAYWVQAPYDLITTFPVKRLEDLKGKKLGHGGPMLPWLAALGATSVQASYNEVYTSMDTGVIDGYSMPANVVTAFKIYEVGKHFTKCALAGANVCGVVTINLRTWNKLPNEVRDILIEVGNEFSWDLHKRNLLAMDTATDVMKEKGVSIYPLHEMERGRWARVLNDAQCAAKTIDNCEKATGYPASDVAVYLTETLESEGYKFPYPQSLDLK
jgi:TRAP-type C4-dicarboxylate transport system substrate-binding protein